VTTTRRAAQGSGQSRAQLWSRHEPTLHGLKLRQGRFRLDIGKSVATVGAQGRIRARAKFRFRAKARAKFKVWFRARAVIRAGLGLSLRLGLRLWLKSGLDLGLG